MPKISVVVPIYNADKYLHRCVDSILSQTFADFELLLINDGSKDNSGVICDEYVVKDSRVRVFHKENSGANSARNFGLENAIGEWVAFVDSDDSLRNDAFSCLYSLSNDQIDAVIANTEYDEIINGEEWTRLLLGCKIRCEVWGTLYRRSLLQKLEFQVPHQIVIGEDFLMNVQYALNCKKVRTISDVIYNYRQGEPMSLVNSYKLTLEHEKTLLMCLETIMSGRGHLFAYEVFRKKYLTLERLIFIGEKPYDEPWVKQLMREKRKYKNVLGLKELFLLSVPYAILSRLFLKVGLFIKSHCKL